MLSCKFKNRLALMVLVVVAVGCRSRRQHDCSGIERTQLLDPCAVLRSKSQGVSTSFGELGGTRQETMAYFQQPLAVDLQNALMLAANHSKLANLIEKERAAVCCEKGCLACVDRFLSAQIRQQRIESAADAAELLIRLSGLSLQAELLNDSREKIAELQQTIDAADGNGLATANAQDELDQQSLELKRKQVALDAGEFEINTKLNLLLGLDSCQPRRLVPEYQFVSDSFELDIEQLIILALSNRPELNALQGFDACNGDEECFSILSSIDRRIALVAPGPVRRTLPSCFEDQRNQCCCQIRQQQIDELKLLREELVRQEVLEQINAVDQQRRTLALENDDLQRLLKQAERIASAAVLDAQDSFISSIENLAEQQLAKSRRINALVEFEVAKLRLDEATGTLPIEFDALAVSCVGCNE